MSGSTPLGDVLRALRQRAAVTQQEAADLAGISVAGLRDVEQGRVVAPRAQTLRRLGVALGLSGAEVAELVTMAHTERARGEPADAWWIGVLGPLVVRVDGAAVDLGSEAQRVLLARLALSPNVALSRTTLTEVTWGSQPPSAGDLLPTRISRLRRWLPSETRNSVLVGTGGGYQLTASEEQLDLLAFRSLVRQARRKRSSGELQAASDLLADAVGRWRGEPLAGLAPLADHPAVVSVVREWRSVVVEYAAVASELGRHAEVIPPLRRVVEADPLHELAHARLMLALAGTGQQATALTVFDSLRRRLADELGADPGPELAAAHLRVLRQEVTRPEVVPVGTHRQLPPDIADFRGREAELRRLYDWSARGAGGDPPMPLIAIEGMGGVGKTRLAIHFAHRLLADRRYADQQLYVDLHGHAEEPPADPAAVLASFLHLLGVPGDRIPSDLAGRSALYRDRLHGTQALVLLDNAASEEQITPLLAAGPTNLVLVTSRRALALDGAHTLPLDVFTTEEAIDFLVHVIGPERVHVDPVAAHRVVDLCGRLPLAVALVARRLQARSAWTLADLAARLAERRNRLSELAAGTRRLRAAFELSYQALPPASKHLFRLLGLHPGNDFTVDSMSALAGASPAGGTRRTIAHLVEEHLVTVSPGNRYRLHDLLRDYAYDLAQQDGPPAGREAVGRLLDWYVSAADAAQRLLFPGRRVLPPDRPQPPDPITFSDDDQALRWLEAEQANLVAAVTAAHDHQLWQAGWQLPAALRHFFERTSNWDDWLATAEAGLAAARQGGDRRGEALALSDLGTAYGHLGQLDRCVGLLTLATRASHALGDREHEAYALNNLGVARSARGQLHEAVGHLQRALELVRPLELPHFQARALSNLGRTLARLGQYEQAITRLRSVLALQSRSEDPVGFAQSLRNLGEALLRNGQPEESARVLRDALTLHRRKRSRADEAETLTTLGEVMDALGRPNPARKRLQQALAILQELRHPYADELRARLAQRAVPIARPSR